MGAEFSNRARFAMIVLVNVVSLAFLVWTLRDARLGDLGADLAGLNWWLIALAIASQLSAYFVQGLRWSEILAPVARLRPTQGARAVFVGIFASEALPIRVGEVLRCYLVSLWTSLPISVTLSSVVIERTFDGLMMWVGLSIVLRTLDVPPALRYATDGLGVFVLIGLALLGVAIVFFHKREAPLPEGGFRRRLAIFVDDLARIGHSWRLLLAFLLTIPYLALQAAPVWILFEGYRFPLGFAQAAALMMLLRTIAALPQAPATLGLFQFVTKEFLERGFAIDPAEAARFSLVLWGVVKLPLLAGGAVALAITGAKLGELRKAATEAQTANR